jgi:ATP-dependent exoDNAse (exonuclease V) beta subunit
VALHSDTSADSKADAVKVLTIHSSKGLEFRYVFLPFWVAGSVPFAGFSNQAGGD